MIQEKLTLVDSGLIIVSGRNLRVGDYVLKGERFGNPLLFN